MTVQAVKLAPSIRRRFCRLGRSGGRGRKSRARPHSRGGHEPFWNISLGTPFSGSLRWVARLPLEAHLMIAHPDFPVADPAHARIDAFLLGGSNDLSWIIGHSKAFAKRVGVAVDPATSATRLEEIVGSRPGGGRDLRVCTSGNSSTRRPRRSGARHGTDQMHLSGRGGGAVDHMTTAPLAVAAGSRRAGSGVGISKGDKGIAAAMQGLRTAATRE